MPLWAMQGHTGAVWGMALRADGLLVASGGLDGTVRLWETSSGRPARDLAGPHELDPGRSAQCRRPARGQR